MPSSTNNNPTLDARPITTEERQYAYSKANYEGRKYVGTHFKKKIDEFGVQPGLIIKFTPSEKIENYKDGSKFSIRYHDGTIDENVSPLDLFKIGVPIKLQPFGIFREEIYEAEMHSNNPAPRGRGRPPKENSIRVLLSPSSNTKLATSKEFDAELRRLKLELKKVNTKIEQVRKIEMRLSAWI